MTRGAAFVAAVGVCAVSIGRTTSAHPLNVYVQVAEIDVARAAVTVSLRMTPGVNVADPIVSSIDVNHDGVISAAEQVAYAERVRRDVALAVDGRRALLRVRSTSFAPVDQLKQGLGDIVLTFDAAVTTGNGRHTVAFENRHQPAFAAYLVNSLQPGDASIAVVAQQRTVDQSHYQLDVEIGAESRSNRPSRAADDVAAVESFFWPGVRHILTGYDHLLFLAALVLAAVSLWDLVKVVTAFTVAHSLTLTLAALNLVHVSDRIVEPVIAASIVFVAIQNVFWPSHARGPSRIAVAFLFGLFHGLGFAGGLLEVMHQMPTATAIFAILGFSLGVEAGNQLVLLPLFGGVRAVRAMPWRSTSWQRVGSALVSAGGVYYLGATLAAVL